MTKTKPKTINNEMAIIQNCIPGVCWHHCVFCLSLYPSIHPSIRHELPSSPAKGIADVRCARHILAAIWYSTLLFGYYFSPFWLLEIRKSVFFSLPLASLPLLLFPLKFRDLPLYLPTLCGDDTVAPKLAFKILAYCKTFFHLYSVRHLILCCLNEKPIFR